MLHAEKHNEWVGEEYLWGDDELEEGYELLEEVIQTRWFREEMLIQGAEAVLRPQGASILDVGFVPKDREGEGFLGLEVLARPRTIGIILRPEEVPYVEVERVMRQDEELRPKLEQGARVVILTRDDLKHWLFFYRQIEDRGLYEEIGPKILEYSGLGRTDELYAERFERATDELLRGEVEKFVEKGVVRVELPARGKFDRAFMNEEGELVGIPINHVRIAKLEAEILVEEVLSEPVIVPGLVVRRPGENKREAYARADNLVRYWRNHWEGRVEVPVISAGQLSIWRKLGMWEKVESYLPETQLSVEEVVRFLYLGKNNIKPGELSQRGLSLPGRGGEFEGVDIIFYGRGVQNESKIQTIDGLVGLNLRKKKRDEEGFLGINDVSGIVIMPDEWSVEKMKDYVEKLRFKLNYRTGGPDTHLLYLTRELFSEWKMRGSAFANENENGYSSLRQKAEYGYGVSGEKQISLRVVRPFAEIGGQKMMVEVEGSGERILNLIDWGTSFQVATPALRDLTSRAPTSIGLRRQFQTGELPMISGIYETEYLLGSIKNFPAILYDQNKDATASYLRAEISHRVAFEQVVQIVGLEKAKKIYELGQKDEKWWYGDHDQVASNIALSHGHVDHVGDFPYLHRELKVWATAETVAHLRAMTRKADSWTAKHEYVSLITQEKEGSAYQKEYREMYPTYWSGQRVNIGNQLQFEFNLANHSLSGMAMVGVIAQGEPLMVYTGDVKPGKWTERTVADIGGQYPVVVMETTNLDDEAKPSSGITEEMVKETLYERIREVRNHAVVVVAPPNHLERLAAVVEISGKLGRKVAISPTHAELVSQMRADKLMLAPLGVDGFDIELPDLGVDVGLWWPPSTDPDKYKKALYERALGSQMGVVDAERLSKEGDKWVILIDPYRIMRHEFGGAFFNNGKLSVLHSAHFPYQANAKWLLGENSKWINEQGGRHYMDFEVEGRGGSVVNKPNYGIARAGGPKKYGLHASGHATFKEMMEVLDGLVAGKFEGKKLVLVHGQHPVRYEKALREYIGMDRPEKLVIHANYDVYDPRKPITRSGFKLKLKE